MREREGGKEGRKLRMSWTQKRQGHIKSGGADAGTQSWKRSSFRAPTPEMLTDCLKYQRMDGQSKVHVMCCLVSWQEIAQGRSSRKENASRWFS